MAREVVSVRAALDVPGETRRQAIVFAIWAFFLGVAVVVGASVGTHIPAYVSDPDAQAEELARSRLARAKVALVFGLLCPGLLTYVVRRRRRRGGAHARGIRVEVTEEGELRLWGRGYGSRVALRGAKVDETLVDLYAGRLGAWRERRMTVSSGARRIQLGTPAAEEDAGLPLLGGEGDCIEVDRADYFALRAVIVGRGAA
jgi:hypothetical protein